jgi:hypothetical protein
MVRSQRDRRKFYIGKLDRAHVAAESNWRRATAGPSNSQSLWRLASVLFLVGVSNGYQSGARFVNIRSKFHNYCSSPAAGTVTGPVEV